MVGQILAFQRRPGEHMAAHSSTHTQHTATGAGLGRLTLEAALEGAVELLAATRVVVVLMRAGGTARVSARRGVELEAAQSLAAVLDDEACRAVLAGGQACGAAAAGETPPSLAGWMTANDERELLVTPLVAAGDLIGALVLGYDRRMRITTATVRAAQTFAAPVALALAADRRATEAERRLSSAAVHPEQALIAPLQRQAELAQGLADVLRVTAAAGTVESASGAAAEILLRVMPAIDLVTVWLLDHDGASLTPVAVAGPLAPARTLPSDLPLDQHAVSSTVLVDGEVHIWQGDQTDWPEPLRAAAERFGLTTIAQVPMLSGGWVTGVICLSARAGYDFTPAEQTFLTSLAGQLGGQLDVVRGHMLAESERQQLISLIDALPEGLLIVRSDGRITLFNQAAVDIFGQPPGASLVEWLVEQYQPCTPDGRSLTVEEVPPALALRGTTVRGVEMVLNVPGDTPTPVLINAAPVLGPDERVTGAVTVFQDISRLKELDRLKDEFINTVSHELRTPTTTIRGGALTLLRRGDRLDEATRRELLQDIADESERLHHLLEDLLSLTRSHGGLRLTPEPIRLHRVANKVVLGLGSRLGSYVLSIDVPSNLPLVDADQIATEQILRNLVENAVKYSPRGGRVELTAEPVNGELVISVLDRGSGIADADLDRVFEPFYRAPGVVSAGMQGAGLGLAVCRRLVEMQGGRIWAERRPGGGEALRFTLPITADTEE